MLPTVLGCAALTIALVACSSEGPPDWEDHPVRVEVARTNAIRAAEPEVVGTHLRRARSILRHAGFQMIVHRSPGRGCNVAPRVIDQHIPRRSKEPAQVWVRVNALTCGLTEEARSVAESFIAFARDELDSPPANAPVDLYVGGRLVTTIEQSRLVDRYAWRGCPTRPGGYAARTCPFSAVEPILERPLQITATPPDLPCGPVQLTPRGPISKVHVAISGGSSCADSFAITLFINTDNQIVAVDVAWSEP